MDLKGFTPEVVAKRALYLAWKASEVGGMGFLQDRGQQPEDVVWAAARGRTDYPGAEPCKDGDMHADYVFGRMMKLSLKWDAANVTVSAGPYRKDYQSFCHVYPTPEALLTAAVESLEKEKQP